MSFRNVRSYIHNNSTTWIAKHDLKGDDTKRHTKANEALGPTQWYSLLKSAGEKPFPPEKSTLISHPIPNGQP